MDYDGGQHDGDGDRADHINPAGSELPCRKGHSTPQRAHQHPEGVPEVRLLAGQVANLAGKRPVGWKRRRCNTWRYFTGEVAPVHEAQRPRGTGFDTFRLAAAEMALGCLLRLRVQ